MAEESQDKPPDPVPGSTKEPTEEELAALKAKYEARDKAGQKAEREGRYSLAIICYKDTITHKIADFGEETSETAFSIHRLGDTYRKIGNLAEAEDCFLKALRTMERVAAAGDTG